MCLVGFKLSCTALFTAERRQGMIKHAKPVWLAWASILLHKASWLCLFAQTLRDSDGSTSSQRTVIRPDLVQHNLYDSQAGRVRQE